MQKISYQFLSTIWKIEVLDASRLVIELRDSEFFKTEWKIIDTKKEHCSLTIDNIKNSWWKNLVCASKDHLVFHELRQGKNPEITATELFNINSKDSTLFASTQFDSISDKGIELIGINNTKTIFEIKNRIESDNYTIQESLIYKSDSTYFNDFASIIKLYTKNEVVMECEYLETPDKICIGYYTSDEKETFSSKLLIIDHSGTKLLETETHQQLKGRINGIFFLLNNQLIYSSSSNELHIITI